MSHKDCSKFLNHYFFFSYLLVVGLCARYLAVIPFSDGRTDVFAIMVWLTYGFFYLLPALVLTRLIHGGLGLVFGNRIRPGWATPAVMATAWITTTATLILLYSDQNLYRLYGFHINGFVWNLLTTPGGVESMGGSDSTMLTFLEIFAGIALIQLVLGWGIRRFVLFSAWKSQKKPRKIYRYALALLLAMTLCERVVYGVSHLQAYRPVLTASGAFPFYLPTTFRSLAKRFGYKVERTARVSFDEKQFALNYPLNPLKVVPPEKLLNIVWLVAESWRSDMLDPEIMPSTYAFSRESLSFLHHYSGGIGTRMGMFSMFYGLYGPYWFPFLNNRQSPVLMDILQEQGYRLGLYTSAKFSYPEFDKTIFAHVPGNNLHEFSADAGWKSDRKNVGDLLAFMKNRDTAHPFMAFMFFESPHARYYFPDESIIRKDYLQDFNYASMNLERDIQGILNRYINSCHHLDSQLERVIRFLKEENLLESTIVIITGDHGEEFMEKGRWGHNSEFTEEQLRVPLILRIPGVAPARVDHITSHLDIPSTLFPLLGVKNPQGDLSLGKDLLGSESRTYTMANDWSRICYISEQYKASFPFKGASFFQYTITTMDDIPVPDSNAAMKIIQKDLMHVMEDLGKFTRKQAS